MYSTDKETQKCKRQTYTTSSWNAASIKTLNEFYVSRLHFLLIILPKDLTPTSLQVTPLTPLSVLVK
jgi:hypothetical protein